MPENFSYRIIFDNQSQTAIIKYDGVLNADQVHIAFCDVASSYDISKTNILWDLSGANFSEFTAQEISKIVARRKRIAELRQGTKLGVIAPDLQHQLLVKLLVAMNTGSVPTLNIFSKFEDAKQYFNLSDDVFSQLG
jgi:hypothetical protein